ncbi:amidase enhancer precursor [Clostridium acetireducens DSM 10703]|jgi:stage II sporulation protein D|uniref:Amidase enhancer n=1 Tax=Clostridium acetireducens DSM 10703 TaxID=1121290 RepID=A0A1E8EVV9_9CLOT|nr:stage II sporulation protein D [Clostridium acetireducens]OFI01407.1 amidase enhancer precursor [Clostridium acetireducens DSM 10703]
MRKRLKYEFFYLKNIFIITFIFLFSVVLLSIILLGTKKYGGKINKYSIKQNNIIFNKYKKGGPDVKIYITKKNKVEKMKLEEYIVGVVAAEMPAEFHIEALKAQAVAARTYAIAHIKSQGGNPCKNALAKGADLCDTVHCQSYIFKEDRLKGWPKENRNKYWNKICKSVKDTEGEIITYNNELVKEPYYFATSSGKTENAKEVFQKDIPYLISVNSPGEEKAPKYRTVFKFSYKDIANKVNRAYPKAKMSSKRLKKQIWIKDRSKSGGVKCIKLGNVEITGQQFRNILGINSANFNIKFNNKNIEVICSGYGHGVGMSQWGANAMGKHGKEYKKIITHYYQGTKISKINYK